MATSYSKIREEFKTGDISVRRLESEDLSSLFYSEPVAEVYQHLRLLSEDKPSNEYTPADFSEKRMKELLGGFFLSKEIVLKDE